MLGVVRRCGVCLLDVSSNITVFHNTAVCALEHFDPVPIGIAKGRAFHEAYQKGTMRN